MELNKTEKKFLNELLKKRITDSEWIIKRSLENSLNPNLPNYTEEAYEKQEKKHKQIINRCHSILEKLV